MKIEIDVADGKLKNLSQTANSELKRVSKEYMEEVLDEASRIEESRRISSSNPEITAAILNDAVVFAKTHGIRKRKTAMQIFMQLTAAVSSIFTGGLFNIDKFNQMPYIIWFLTVFAITVISNVYLIFFDKGND